MPKDQMKVLLACSHTAALYKAITANGHDVTTCDYKPAQHAGKHYQGNVFDIIDNGFQIMIAFPPCTYLSKAQEWRVQQSHDRKIRQVSAAEFVMKLFKANISQIAIENPVGYLSRAWQQPNQIVRPWFFGDPYHKAICLWLKNLPPLMSTLYNPHRKSINNHTNSRMNQDKKSEIRSSWDYFPGMCQAIANQWCPPVKSQAHNPRPLLVYPMSASLTVLTPTPK